MLLPCTFRDGYAGIPVPLRLFLWSIPHRNDQRGCGNQECFESPKKKTADEQPRKASASCHAHLSDSPHQDVECKEVNGGHPLEAIRGWSHKSQTSKEWCRSTPRIFISSEIQIISKAVNSGARNSSFVEARHSSTDEQLQAAQQCKKRY